MFTQKRDVSNVLSVLVYCQHDNTFLLLLDEERGDYWIPSTKMDDSLSWKDNLQTFKKEVKKKLDFVMSPNGHAGQLFDYEIIKEKLLKIIKIWFCGKSYYHLIFQVSLPQEVKACSKTKTQTKLGVVGWYTCSQLLKLKSQLRSLEILEMTHNYTPNIHRQTGVVTGEVLPMGCLTEIREEDILCTIDNCSEKIIELLDSSAIPIEEQYELYNDYFMETYPCTYLNRIGFEKLISKLGFIGNYQSLFRAADVWTRDFLTFQDYLLMVAVMEPYTGHYGTLAETRCRYIFRYYNQSGTERMTCKDLQRLLRDILILRLEVVDEKTLDKTVESQLKALNFKSNSTMTFDQFYGHVLQAMIQDTAQLLRSMQSHNYGTMSSFQRDTISDTLVQNQILLSGPSGKGSQTDYKVLVKTVLLKPGDVSMELKDLRILEEAMTKSVVEDLKIISNIKLFRKELYDIDARINELLLALKYFCTEITSSPSYCGEFEFGEKEAYSWGTAFLEKLALTLVFMCEEMKEILGKETRLLRLNAPVYILGDLHGNFHDLMCFEKTLWSNGLSFLPGKLVFLGDYVDRGLHGLEVVMYLFAQKIKYPEKLYLIRGNHEIREIQKMFTFHRECLFKLGTNLGTAVWKAVNDVFDMMPLAAVVDGKIFCCHGGIPPPWLCPIISVIDLIPCPLSQCDKQSPLAWALMWNDPIRTTIRNSVQEMELVTNDGFLPNVHRGTAYTFSCDALDKFLKTNKLSHVVRAHEVVRAGFQVHQKGKLLTVFSSSGYCGGKNYAAGVLVADQFLRVFMVDTGIN